MRATSSLAFTGLLGIAVASCSHTTRSVDPGDPPPVAIRSNPEVILTSHWSAEREERPSSEELIPSVLPIVPTATVGLPELIDLTVGRNPRLAQVTWAVDVARGRAVQSGLYPNPVINATGDELGDRTGPGGIWTTPMVYQEIVTANKLGLSKAAALKEVDQATLNTISERYRVFTEVRQNFFEVVVLQRRIEVLGELVGLAEKSVENANKLLKAKEVSELDVVQLEVDLERYRADLDATKKTLPAAFR
jgi:cobalt-zinc-cadmium efflux system outer membrane protein